MTRDGFFALVREAYGIAPDYPFARDSETAVLRHPHNRKWFAVVMRISPSKVGLAGDAPVDVVNLKCDPSIISDFWREDGVFPAYHMNRGHWLTAALDGSASHETVRFLLGVSFTLTEGKKKTK